MVDALVSGEKGAFAEVAHESFTLPSRYYVDPDIHEQEIRKIFQRSWLYVGHLSDLPEVGSYLTEDLAGQPILVVRAQDKELRAFFNVCQHRGLQVEVNSRVGLSVLPMLGAMGSMDLW